MENWEIVILVLTALILSKVFDHILIKIIKKVDTDYMTKKQCEDCTEKEGSKIFKREIREKLGLITGILLVMASGKEVSQDLIEKLVTGQRS